MYVCTTMIVLTNSKQSLHLWILYHGTHRFDLVRVLWGRIFWTLNEKKHNWYEANWKKRPVLCCVVLGQLWWEIGTDPFLLYIFTLRFEFIGGVGIASIYIYIHGSQYFEKRIQSVGSFSGFFNWNGWFSKFGNEFLLLKKY